MSLELVVVPAYALVGVCLLRPIARSMWRFWRSEFPLTGTKQQATVVSMIAALLWPLAVVVWTVTCGADALEDWLYRGVE